MATVAVVTIVERDIHVYMYSKYLVVVVEVVELL